MLFRLFFGTFPLGHLSTPCLRLRGRLEGMVKTFAGSSPCVITGYSWASTSMCRVLPPPGTPAFTDDDKL